VLLAVLDDVEEHDHGVVGEEVEPSGRGHGSPPLCGESAR